MYVIFNAADVVEESYLALVSQESEVATGLDAVTQNLNNSQLPPPPPPPHHPTLPYPLRPSLQHQHLPNGGAAAPAVYHDTRPEQQRAQEYIERVCDSVQLPADPLQVGFHFWTPGSD